MDSTPHTIGADISASKSTSIFTSLDLYGMKVVRPEAACYIEYVAPSTVDKAIGALPIAGMAGLCAVGAILNPQAFITGFVIAMMSAIRRR